MKVFEKSNEKSAVRVELFQQVHVRVSSEEKGGARDKGKRRVRIVVLTKK